MTLRGKVIVIGSVVVFFSALVALSVHSAFGPGSTGLTAAAQRDERVGDASGGDPSDAVTGDGDATAGDAINGTTGATTARGRTATTLRNAARGPRVVPGVPGVTSSTIRIGIRYMSDKSATTIAGAMGINAAPGNTRGSAQAMVDELNAHGGLAGRKIDPFFVEYDATKVLTGQAAAEHQAACESFASDGHVFAVVSPIPAGTLQAECLQDKKVPYIQDSVGWYHDDDVMAKLPDFSMPAVPNASRVARLWVKGLNAQSYFSKNAKVGVVRLNGPVWDRIMKEDLRPALQAVGHPIDGEVVLTDAQQIASGVLEFKARGITHVLVMDDNGLVGTVWMTQAQSQGYHPRYGLNSINSPELLEANAPPAQLSGSVGVGWARALDVSPSSSTDKPSAQDRACEDIMRRHGISLDDRTGYGVTMYTCDVFLFLKRMLDGTAELSPAGLQASLASIGASYSPTGTYGAFFSRTQHDGATLIRNFAFDAGCTCFNYTSEPQAAA